jgi:hypothetical protein
MASDIPTREEIKAMTVDEYKALENRLRRASDRQGLRLEKSRARDPRALTYGTYQLVQVTAPGGHWRSRNLTAGDTNTGYGLDLHEVAQFLFEDINVHVYQGPDHEVADWYDENNPNREPVLTYRDTNTTGARVKGRLTPDGWVLDIGDGDEWIVGAWDVDTAPVAAAKDYLRWQRFSR